MWRNTIICTALAALVLTLGLAPAGQSAPEPGAKLRVGVYDSRAIAIAYGNSEFNPVAQKKQQHKAAKAAGDEAKVRELEEWGPRHQRQLHRQGFGRVPVTDLLEHVRDRLPEVAQKTGVDVIAFECNYLGPGVEEVDITLQLAMLFNPSKKALGWIEDMKDVEPLDLDEIEKHHDDH
jgi:hypothetical protein